MSRDKNITPLKVAILSVQVLVPIRGQEHCTIPEKTRTLCHVNLVCKQFHTREIEPMWLKVANGDVDTMVVAWPDPFGLLDAICDRLDDLGANMVDVWLYLHGRCESIEDFQSEVYIQQFRLRFIKSKGVWCMLTSKKALHTHPPRGIL